MRAVMRAGAVAIVMIVQLSGEGGALAQARERAAKPAAAAQGSDAAALAAGWTAVAAGRYDEAAKSAEQILRRRPWDRGALALRIGALAAAAPSRGLDAYEQWIGAKHSDDAGLLEPVAIATLREIAN